MDRRAASGVAVDTSPEVWRKQMGALEAMTPQRRLQLWEALNAELAELEERALRRQHPSLDDREVLVELVRRRYGEALAGAVGPAHRHAAS